MATITGLDSFFTNLITNILAIERQTVTRLQQNKDVLNQKRGVYADLEIKLGALRNATRALISTNPFFAVTLGRSVDVVNAPTGKTVISASVSSSAVPGEYDIEVTALAKAERKASAVQSSADQALGKSGTIWLGGDDHQAAEVISNTTISEVGIGAVADGFRELGTGNYIVETRNYEGTLQFRLKDADGNVVAIADQESGSNSLTTAWQTITTGTYDTKRGLTITFTGTAEDATTSVSYTAKGVAVTVEASDSLVSIANKINDALQPQGRDLVATVVGNQLVFTTASTGTNHTMIYSFADGLDFGTFSTLQSAANATFSVNNIEFTRQSNSNLTDVINGVTLNLAADAETNSATLVVSENVATARSTIDNFISQMNSVLTYLVDKTSVTKQSDGTFARGILADEGIFNDMRNQLLSLLISNVETNGRYRSLREIGLTVGDTLLLSVSDASKLEEALKTHYDDVVALFDELMGSIDTLLGRFIGSTETSGYLDTAIDLFDDQMRGLDNQINYENERLEDKEQSLISQYSQMQAQLVGLAYMQQLWQGIYGNYSRLY